MDKSFTDKLIKDLNKSEQDARRVNRRIILREVIEDMWASSAVVTLIIFVLGPLLFGVATYSMIIPSNRIPVVEERIFQLFEVRGISVEIMSLKDPILSEVVEEVKVTFSEFVDIAAEHEMVYFSRTPMHRFFIVGEYWDIIHYYDNPSIDSVYASRRVRKVFTSVFPFCVFGGLVAFIRVYISYRTKYKEMVGF